MNKFEMNCKQFYCNIRGTNPELQCRERTAELIFLSKTTTFSDNCVSFDNNNCY